jgi:large subunit ribosomal protein L22
MSANQQKKETNEVSAFLKSIKSSPLKILKLTRNLSGMSASDAIKNLKFCNLKVAPVVSALIYSAMSNAENNHNLDIDNLVIGRIEVGKSFVLKRFSARARGRSNRITKTYSSIRVVFVENN